MNTSNWSRDLGIFGSVADLGDILPAIAFGIGLTFGLSFDTAGPKREGVEHDTRAADEPLAADREPNADPQAVPVGGRSSDTNS